MQRWVVHGERRFMPNAQQGRGREHLEGRMIFDPRSKPAFRILDCFEGKQTMAAQPASFRSPIGQLIGGPTKADVQKPYRSNRRWLDVGSRLTAGPVSRTRPAACARIARCHGSRSGSAWWQAAGTCHQQ